LGWRWLDVLINDAAYNVAIPFVDLDNLTLEVWNDIMAINLTGPEERTSAGRHSTSANDQTNIACY
jgi:NAD(P)-dependent dehydrogenase (short-subunit alcohol dehydrogenase family)